MNLHPSHATQKIEWVKVDGEKIEAEWIDFYDNKLSTEAMEVLKKQKIPISHVRLCYLKPNEREGKRYLTKFKNINYFDYQGDVWHHLHRLNVKIKPNEIIKRFGEWWILTSAKTHEKYLKQSHSKYIFDDKINNELVSMKYGFDDYEVFIKKI